MAEKVSFQGIAKNVRTHTQVSGGGGGGAGGGAVHVHVSSYEVMTFDLHQAGEAAKSPIHVEIVGKRARFRSVPVSDEDEVRVEGNWKKRRDFLRAREIENLSTGVTSSGRRWG